MQLGEGADEGALFDRSPSTPTFDPEPDEAVPPPSSRPAPSSTEPPPEEPRTPGSVGSTTGPDGEQPAEQSEEQPQEQEPPPEFDPRHRDDFIGLMYLGRLTDSFEWLGHRFSIRTLTTEEVIEVGLLLKPYAGTIAEDKAYQVLTLAAAVETVDGRSLVSELGPERLGDTLQARADYIRQRWYPTTIDALYEKVMVLEYRARQVLDAMGNRSG